MKGIVKSFSPKRGYGFIISEDGAEYFAHFSKIKMNGYKTLETGQEVEFEAESTPRGFSAADIIVLNRA